MYDTDLIDFCRRFGCPLYPHQVVDFGAAAERQDGRFRYRMAGISWPRGDGKTEGGARFGLWRLVTAPAPQTIVSAALDFEGAKIILKSVRQIIRQHPVLQDAITIRADRIEVPETGSTWQVVSREHTSSRGLHPDLVIYDECGWAKDDELFASLLAGQASVDDPLMLVISTVGRQKVGPLWTVQQLAEGGDPSVLWRWSGENRSPRVTPAFLDRQKRILMPTQYAREHQNLWVDAADAFTAAADIDAMMGDGWTEQAAGAPGMTYEYFVDLGSVHDPTVIAVGHLDAGIVYIDRLVTLQGSREAPVQIAVVEATIRDLAARFPPRRIRIESWQGISSAQSLQRLGLPVELFAPTAKAHANEWPILAQRLAARTVICAPHARLREELLNLTCEVGPHGVRVIDRGRIHQDHAVAVRGVVAALSMIPKTIEFWGGAQVLTNDELDQVADEQHASAVAAVLDGIATEGVYWP